MACDACDVLERGLSSRPTDEHCSCMYAADQQLTLFSVVRGCMSAMQRLDLDCSEDKLVVSCMRVRRRVR